MRPYHAAGRIICQPILGGLHHQYTRILICDKDNMAQRARTAGLALRLHPKTHTSRRQPLVGGLLPVPPFGVRILGWCGVPAATMQTPRSGAVRCFRVVPFECEQHATHRERRCNWRRSGPPLCKTRYGLLYLIGGRVNQFIKADPSLSSSLQNRLGEIHLYRWTCIPRRYPCHHHFKGSPHGSDEFWRK
jgi:hypothetical protein